MAAGKKMAARRSRYAGEILSFQRMELWKDFQMTGWNDSIFDILISQMATWPHDNKMKYMFFDGRTTEIVILFRPSSMLGRIPFGDLRAQNIDAVARSADLETTTCFQSQRSKTYVSTILPSRMMMLTTSQGKHCLCDAPATSSKNQNHRRIMLDAGT